VVCAPSHLQVDGAEVIARQTVEDLAAALAEFGAVAAALEAASEDERTD
jgi:hypothetical protein